MQAALSAWIRLGSSKAAAKETNVSDSTLRTWKERNPDLWDDLRQAHARELEKRHADNVKRAWSDLNEAAQIAMQRIRDGLYADGREFLALARCVSEFAKAGDTVARLDADKPTSIVENRTDAEVLERVERMASEMGVTIELPALDPHITTTAERH